MYGGDEKDFVGIMQDRVGKRVFRQNCAGSVFLVLLLPFGEGGESQWVRGERSKAETHFSTGLSRDSRPTLLTGLTLEQQKEVSSAARKGGRAEGFPPTPILSKRRAFQLWKWVLETAVPVRTIQLTAEEPPLGPTEGKCPPPTMHYTQPGWCPWRIWPGQLQANFLGRVFLTWDQPTHAGSRAASGKGAAEKEKPLEPHLPYRNAGVLPSRFPPNQPACFSKDPPSTTWPHLPSVPGDPDFLCLRGGLVDPVWGKRCTLVTREVGPESDRWRRGGVHRKDTFVGLTHTGSGGSRWPSWSWRPRRSLRGESSKMRSHWGRYSPENVGQGDAYQGTPVTSLALFPSRSWQALSRERHSVSRCSSGHPLAPLSGCLLKPRKGSFPQSG